MAQEISIQCNAITVLQYAYYFCHAKGIRCSFATAMPLHLNLRGLATLNEYFLRILDTSHQLDLCSQQASD